MIKKLHLFVLKSFIGPFIVTFLISLFILLMQFLWRYVEDLVGKGLEWYVVAKLMMYASASLIQMALPLAILLASIMTFGSLGEYYELTAIKSAGISLQRIMIPLVILSFIISIGAFLFSNYILPYTNLKMGAILFDVSHQRPEINIKPGIFNNGVEGYSIKVNKKSRKSNMMYDFMIYDHSASVGNPVVVLADSGTMVVTDDEKYMVVTLYNGNRYEETQEENMGARVYPHRHDNFQKQTMIFELKGFNYNETDERMFRHNYQMLNLKQLQNAIDSLSKLYVEREVNYLEMLGVNYYFRYENKVPRNADSLIKKTTKISKPDVSKLPVKSNLDSFYSSLSHTEKMKVLEYASDYAEKTQAHITTSNEELFDREKWINKHKIAWHTKFSLSFACFIFFFIGAPLGAIIRKGGFGLPFIVAIAFFVIYYIISMASNKFVREGVIDAYIGMWISSIIILPLGAFLTWKATTDSTLVNADSYIASIEAFLKRLKLKFIINLFS